MSVDRPDMFEPWLGAGVVALFGPGAPVSKINEMCKAKHISHWSGGGSKRTPRLYSFAAAVQIHALYQASRAGLAPRIGSGIGSKALERIVARTEEGDTLGEGRDSVFGAVAEFIGELDILAGQDHRRGVPLKNLFCKTWSRERP